MTGRIEKTVFISYRRTNFWTALAVFKELHSNGYDVFFDYKSIPSGDFEQVITENVRSRAHFIVILSPSALERCNEPGDWLRREIEIAIDSKRNIIPLMMEGFDFGSPTTVNALIGKLADLKKFNAMGIPAEYFDEAMIKLRGDRFLNRPLESISHPVSEITKQITEAQKSAASEAPPVEKEELTSQEWYERGYVFSENKNFDEAIRCFTEAIKLEPNNASAYAFRGDSRREKGDLDGALEDLNTAIQLEPKNSAYYGFRGFARKGMGDLPGAIEDYSESIRIESDSASIYTLRGLAYADKGKLDDAIKDFDNAINYNPDGSHRYLYRGEAWEKKRNYSKAIIDYQKYLELGGELEWVDPKELQDTIKKLKRRISKKKQVKKKAK